ncbi:MAG: penicillin-binding protein 2 [Anaplasmataceae bacterium]|nr:penicillin-binding protein 2 [Anaplasmataceae bacterium]
MIFLIIIRLFTFCFHCIDKSINNSDYYKKYINYNRPKIFDRNGIILASNLKVNSLYINPKLINDVNDTAKAINDIFPDISLEYLLHKLKKDNDFAWIKRKISPEEAKKIAISGIPGIFFADEYQRIYPMNELFSHIIGYVDIDNNGLSGFERYIDKNNITDNEIKLSLDTRIQSILREEIQIAIKDNRAIGGSGMIVSAENNEVIAAVNLPDFNPHYPSAKQNTFNQLTMGRYEFGSIFKLFTVLMALDSKKIDIKDTFDISKNIVIDRNIIRDMSKRNNKNADINDIFRLSSNIGIAQIALRIGLDIQREYLKKLKFFDRLPIEIPEQTSTSISSETRNINVAAMGYGYGISTSLAHITQAEFIALNGYYKPLTIVLGKNATIIPEQILERKQTSEELRLLLRNVVLNGTGKKALVSGYDVGGKTGSAEKIINGKYSKKSNIVSFLGAFPISKPKYMIAIMIDEPLKDEATSRTITSSRVVGPIIKNTITRIISVLNMVSEK